MNLATFSLCILVMSFAVRATADEKSNRELRHELFVKTALGLEIEYDVTSADDDSAMLNVVETSVLRYYNPVRGRSNDGEMFVLNDIAGVPRCIAAVSLRNGRLFIEAVSVSTEPLRGRLPGFGKWKPEFGGSGRQVATLQPPYSPIKSRQLAAMRRIASSVKFEFRNSEWTHARLLTQPLFRYETTDADVKIGALFAYGESNDPEALLHVWYEASDDDPGRWYFLAASSTSLPLKCIHGDDVIWNKPGYWVSPRPPESPYVEALIDRRPDLVDENGEEKGAE